MGFKSLCAVVVATYGIVGIIGGVVLRDQHEIRVRKGNRRVVHVRDRDVCDEIGVSLRRRE